MRVDPVQERLIAKMRALDDWLERYEYLIGLGESLPRMDAAHRTEEQALNGCQSRVWISAELVDGRMRFRGECDAKITNGVLALVLSIVEGRTPEDVAEIDLYSLHETGLMTSLSPSRASGLAAIIKRVRELAVSLQERPRPAS